MPTFLTGSLGALGGQLGLLQLGGPPLTNTYGRPLPPKALPLLAHVYQNDGVTFRGSFPILNRPSLKATTTNGGYNQITLEVDTRPGSGMIWGAFVWGSQTYGGTGVPVNHGNVIRLTEVGGPYAGFVYGGIVEGFPDTITSSGVSHQVLVSPFGFELDDTFSQAVYTTPTDVSQVVQQAVALTKHCSCDQVSVPASTGVSVATTGAVDFRNQSVKSIIDTCRSIMGPTWYWYCDELGRVWFQPMGSGTVYNIPRSQFEERTRNGGSIQNLKNQIVAVGGVPTGGSANITATYNGSSQSLYGIRSLNPPLQVPNITDSAALGRIATGIGGVLDRIWNVLTVKTLPTYAQRIHGSQPGGAMVRTWEPSVNPMQESEIGTGYAGPYIAQSVEYDGLRQIVTAGDIPVTSQTDIQNMVNSLVSRAAAIALQNTAAMLNLTQTLTGTFQSGIGTPTLSGVGALWSLTQQMFQAFDPNAVPRLQLGNLPANGISPAQWGGRVNDANNVPLWDSLGVIGIPRLLGSFTQNNSQNITSVDPTFTLLTGSAITFTLARAANIFSIAVIAGFSATQSALVVNFLDGANDSSGFGVAAQWGANTPLITSPYIVFDQQLPAGSHTLDLRGALLGGAGTLTISQYFWGVFQYGG